MPSSFVRRIRKELLDSLVQALDDLEEIVAVPTLAINQADRFSKGSTLASEDFP
jgi:hypothetical protein